MLGGPRGAPRAKARPGFPVQNADSQHTVCVEMLPQVPHRHTNLSIHDDTRTTRGRIRTTARARWVPSPHFLPTPVFRCKTPTPNIRCVSRCFPKYPAGTRTHQYTTTHAQLVAGYVPQLVHGGCLPPTFWVFAPHPVIGTHGPVRDASPLNNLDPDNGDTSPQPVSGEASRRGGLTRIHLPFIFLLTFCTYRWSEPAGATVK